MYLISTLLFMGIMYLFLKNNNNDGGSDLTELRAFHENDVNISDFPYYASVENCGAAIISDSWLVTTAHCVSTSSNLILIGGEIKTSEMKNFKVITHPEYSKAGLLGAPKNDIALLKLEKPLNFSDKVKPIKLPGEKENYLSNSKQLFIGNYKTGFPPKHLIKMEITALTPEQCLSYIPKVYHVYIKPYLPVFRKVSFCAKRYDDKYGICFGESGGPLIQDNTLVGLASYIADSNCYQAQLGFFTNIANYVPWIKSVIGIN